MQSARSFGHQNGEQRVRILPVSMANSTNARLGRALEPNRAANAATFATEACHHLLQARLFSDLRPPISLLQTTMRTVEQPGSGHVTPEFLAAFAKTQVVLGTRATILRAGRTKLMMSVTSKTDVEGDLLELDLTLKR